MRRGCLGVGALTAQSNPYRKFRGTEWENAVMIRFILKL